MSIAKAKEVIDIEAKAIIGLKKKINSAFMKAVGLLAKCQGRVVVTGMGKTGIVGRKIAATLSSTGTPSIFMHSAEAVHGDLGQITKDDVVIVISSSGETEETVRLIPSLKRIPAKIIALTGNVKSTMAKHCDVVLDVKVEKEGCPLGLAPMASTTAVIVMGDALAACLIVRKKFRRENFAVFHPGGILGKKLLLRIEDVMRKGINFSKVKGSMKVKDVLLSITKMRCGSACVLDSRNRFAGIFTDGDLRRHLEADPKILERQVKDVMTRDPLTIQDDQLAVDAIKLLRGRKIDELPVLNARGKLVGLLDIQDLLKSGLV